MTSSTNALNGCVLTTGIQPDGSFRNVSEENNATEGEANSSPLEFADIEDILATLELLDNEPSSNSQLDLAKSAYGCQWTDSFMCPHGDFCPFITQFHGLDDFQEPAAVSSQPPRVTSVVVLRQTPNGLVKLQESLMPLGQEEVKRLQAMTPQEQVRHLGLNTAQLRQGNTKQVIGNTSNSTLQLREQGSQFARPGNTAQYNMSQYSVPMSNSTTYSTDQFSVPVPASQQYSAVSSANTQYTTLSSNMKYRSSGSVPYRPPPNAVLVKVPTSVLQNHSSYQFSIPTPSPSPPTTSSLSALSPPSSKYPLLCSECDSQFQDSKSLVKHTRNQHQTYQCNKCGEETVGYYRMASHTKKNHSRHFLEHTFISIDYYYLLIINCLCKVKKK